MGTYNLPRNVKGEGRILFIFSGKALIYTAVGVGIGLLFYFITSAIGISIVGLVIMAVLGLAGFVIGTMKMPTSNAFEVMKKTGGENIDDVIKRTIKFKMQKNRIYVNEINTKDEEEVKND